MHSKLHFSNITDSALALRSVARQRELRTLFNLAVQSWVVISACVYECVLRRACGTALVTCFSISQRANSRHALVSLRKTRHLQKAADDIQPSEVSMFAVSFGVTEACINNRDASSNLDNSPAFCVCLHSQPQRCVVLRHSTQACLASRFRSPRSRQSCKSYRSTRTTTPKHILQQPGSARRISSKCRAVGALVQDGWPLWAALSACAAGGQVHLQNFLKLHAKHTWRASHQRFFWTRQAYHAVDCFAGVHHECNQTCLLQVLEQRTSFGSALSAPLLSLLLALLLSAGGVLPTDTAAYDMIWTYVMPLGAALYLLESDLRHKGHDQLLFLLSAFSVTTVSFTPAIFCNSLFILDILHCSVSLAIC